jgi:hypothetical protein
MTRVPPPQGANEELYTEQYFEMVGEPFLHDEYSAMAGWIISWLSIEDGNENKSV